MFKLLLVVFCTAISVACQPINQEEKLDFVEIKPHCITSQSQCLITGQDIDISVYFSQNIQGEIKQSHAKDNIITELDFSILLSLDAQTTKKKKIKTVSAYLEGRDMFMGKIPVFFNELRQEKKNTLVFNDFNINPNEIKYIAKSLLANCTEDKMIWRLWLTLEILDVGNESLEQQKQTFFVDFTAQRF